MRMCFFALVLVGSELAQAGSSDICVQNFNQGNQNPCLSGQFGAYAYAVGLVDPNKKICAHVYAESFCNSAEQEFVHIVTSTGKSACVVNFNQAAKDYCVVHPKNFDYVKASAD